MKNLYHVEVLKLITVHILSQILGFWGNAGEKLADNSHNVTFGLNVRPNGHGLVIFGKDRRTGQSSLTSTDQNCSPILPLAAIKAASLMWTQG